MLADSIAKMIEEMLDESHGILELQRNEMASKLGCVPSQISYVISSRFPPDRGAAAAGASALRGSSWAGTNT